MRAFAFPTTMDRYIGRLMAKPLAITLVLSAMLFLLDKLRRLLDFVVDQGGSPKLVFTLLANILPTYVSFGLVVGSLLSVIFAFRRLALSAELDVLRATGVSYGRMLAVPFCFAVLLTMVNVGLVGFVQPHARYAYKRIEFDLRSGAFGMAVRPGEFAHLGPSQTLRIGNVAKDGLSDIFIKSHVKRHEVSITARNATVLATPDREAIVFRLADGVLVDETPGRTPRLLNFTRHDLRIPLPRIGPAVARGNDADELTLIELASAARGRSAGRATPVVATANLNFRLVEIATLWVLPLLGLPLAVPPKRTASGLGIFVGILVLVAWYKLDQYLLARAVAGKLDPVLGFWVPFAIFAISSGWFYHAFAHRVGGHPLSSMEAGWARLRKLWRR